MSRPRKPDGERRTKLFYVRLLPCELEELEEASRRRKESISAILRNGAAMYLKPRPGPASASASTPDGH